MPVPRPPLDDLLAYLAASPSPYHATNEAALLLDAAGFHRLDLDAAWDGAPDRAYTLRSGALVAWHRPAGLPAAAPFRITGAHTDSPNLRLKPRPDAGAAGWQQLAIEVYGGALVNSWLDRDLGLSGRLVLADGTARLLRIERPLARVPQLAIHLDREVNERGLVLDRQVHLAPVWGLGAPGDGALAELVAAEAGVAPGEVVSGDLMLHDLTPPARLGRDGELLAAGRIDNLVSCWAAIQALIAAAPADATAMAALFDHEEVGSESADGAAGPLLESVIERLVARSCGGVEERHRAIAGSMCVSADMAHAVHPNYVERHEPGHRPLPNAGPVVKVNANQRYATDALTAARFRRMCDDAAVPHQVFVSRNNVPCGSTIGPVTATRLGIATVDVGCAQLSMHSARELCGAQDPPLLAAALTAFFTT
jgi:aspartyl aminopeptidase